MIICSSNCVPFNNFPDNINTLYFTECEINKCINFPKNVNKVYFCFTPFPKDFEGFSSKLEFLSLITPLQFQNHCFSFLLNSDEKIKKIKTIIEKFVGNLTNLSYNLKIDNSEILNKEMPLLVQSLLKKEIKSKLKAQYRKDNVYKKLYKQLIPYNH